MDHFVMLKSNVRPASAQLAATLKKAMEKEGVGNADLARACGVTVQAVTGWLKTGRLSKRHLPVISRLVKKSIPVLLGDTAANDLAPPLNDVELDLIVAFRELPTAAQIELRDQLMTDAKKWHQYAMEVLRRQGATTLLSNERAGETMEPAPKHDEPRQAAGNRAKSRRRTRR
jgi:hypothetical protein